MFKFDGILNDQENKVLKFLENRFNSKNYRGLHIFQHERLTEERFIAHLECIYSFGNDYIKIPKNDIKSLKNPNGFEMINYPQYEEYLNKYRNLINDKITTPMQIKKNTFPTLSRMRLIERFQLSKTGEYILKKEGFGTKVNFSHIKRTSLIDNFDNWSQKAKIDLFYKSSLKMMDIFFEELIEVLNNLPKNEMTFEEFYLFFTFLKDNEGNYKINYDDKEISIKNIIELIKEYRSFSEYVKKSIILNLNNYANPDNFSGKKTIKKDMHNLRNESQEIFTILKECKILSIIMNKNKFSKITLNYDYKDLNFIPKRNPNIKNLFLKKNKITSNYFKGKAFDLDHIFPFSFSTTPKLLNLIDNEDNLIYISSEVHALKTRNNNKFIILEKDENFKKNKSLIYKSYVDNDKIIMEYGKHYFLDEDNIDKVLEYNKYLRSYKEIE